MSAVATVVGLTVATTTAAIVLMKYVNEEFLSFVNNNSSTETIWLDPHGPSVQFVLFGRNLTPFNLKLNNNNSLQESGFSVNKTVKIITHGFYSSIKYEVFLTIKDAYLETGDYNVIGMDWSVLSRSKYKTAVKGVEIAGKTLSHFVNWLNYSGVPLDNIHLIGHSLGAHVVGVGGYYVKKGRVARITGLDPAGPGYVDMRQDLKLDSRDAKLVDVIHTYINVLSLSQPLGHVDFYPNGGRYQPGCPGLYDIFKVSESLLCNHGRSYHLFSESIRNRYAFRSKKCRSVDDALTGKCFIETNVHMGQANTYRNGLYYLKTDSEKPYSLPNK